MTAVSPARAAPATDVKVCVRIEEKTWGRDGTRQDPKEEAPTAPVAGSSPASVPPQPAPPAPSAASASPHGQPPGAPSAATAALAPLAKSFIPATSVDEFAVDPKRYLKRLVEYHVSHERGFEAVPSACTETITVDLYAVQTGFTAFARYTGTGREEKVDVVQLDELATFAERVTTALLRDRTIGETLTRTTVLRADSDTQARRVQSRPQFLASMGSNLRFGELPTALNETSPAVDRFRVETPLTFRAGARSSFRNWALDATGRLSLGFQNKAPRKNRGGGHVDYGAGIGLGLGFIRYHDPDAINTLYYGAGASFEVSRYQAIPAADLNGYQMDATGLWGGGLNVELSLGYEFMRTSAAHFFIQGTAVLPAYVFQAENDESRVHAYLPGADVEIGLLF